MCEDSARAASNEAPEVRRKVRHKLPKGNMPALIIRIGFWGLLSYIYIYRGHKGIVLFIIATPIFRFRSPIAPGLSVEKELKIFSSSDVRFRLSTRFENTATGIKSLGFRV